MTVWPANFRRVAGVLPAGRVAWTSGVLLLFALLELAAAGLALVLPLVALPSTEGEGARTCGPVEESGWVFEAPPSANEGARPVPVWVLRPSRTPSPAMVDTTVITTRFMDSFLRPAAKKAALVAPARASASLQTEVLVMNPPARNTARS
ncbi:hypothetical protein GCM10023317_92780 [Actinopolymorpha pittospori]